MKKAVIISLVVGVLMGVLAYHTWLAKTATARHWRAVKSYLAYVTDPSNYKLDSQTGFSWADPPKDDIEPHLAALVAAGELQHLDILLPTVPYPNRAAMRYFMEFCKSHPEDIVYYTGNSGYGPFPVKGQQPIHLNIWFPKTSEPVVQQLISELEEMGTGEASTK